MADPTLRRGSRGEDVERLQRALANAGFAVAADGVFGPDTETAVKGFQTAEGLAADGVVGRLTWQALGRQRLRLAREAVLVDGFDGFGAQYNHNVYAARSRDVGVTAENVKVMEQRMTEFAPHLVRVFFNADALADDDLLQSFRRTMGLAQQTAGAINVTLQGLGPNVLQAHPQLIQLFARELTELVTQRGLDRLKWVTLRNEPNSPAAPMKKELYAECYRELDRELRAAGLRPRLGFMGGDLLREKQREWFDFLAAELADLLDAYSVHIYWDYQHPEKIRERLREVREIRRELPALREKPFYVMECGVRGAKTSNGITEDPGFWQDGARIATTNVNAFQRAWFALDAVRHGYSGVIAWDAYAAKYDRNSVMHYSLLGGPNEAEPWPRRPAYRALRLLARAIEPGWKAVAVEGGSASQIVVGFVDAANGGGLAVAGLDTAGGSLNAASASRSTYVIGGLPPDTRFQLSHWNEAGDGLNSFDGEVRSDAGGVATVTAPIHSLFVLTTRRIS